GLKPRRKSCESYTARSTTSRAGDKSRRTNDDDPRNARGSKSQCRPDRARRECVLERSRPSSLYGILLILASGASFSAMGRYLSVKESPTTQSTEEIMKKAKA